MQLVIQKVTTGKNEIDAPKVVLDFPTVALALRFADERVEYIMEDAPEGTDTPDWQMNPKDGVKQSITIHVSEDTHFYLEISKKTGNQS